MLSANALLSQTIQTYNIDSLKEVLSQPLSDTARIWALNNLGRNIPNSDSTVLLAEQAIRLSRNIGYVKGEAEARNNLGHWFNQKGNYLRSMENYLVAIKLADSINFEGSLKRSYNSIASVYYYRKDYATSINYGYKAMHLATKLNDPSIVSLSASWLSQAYMATNQPDSALKYAQKSYEIATQLHEPFQLYMATARLGDVHGKQGNYALAIEYLRMSLTNSIKDGRYFRIADAHQRLAVTFGKAKMTDSCRWHATQAFTISQSQKLSATLLTSSLLLSGLYDGSDNSESLRYHKIALIAMDSLYGQEKNSQIEALSLNERLRQLDVEEQRRQAQIERRNGLQYAGMTLGIVLFVIIFLVLSRSKVVKPRLVRFLGVLALLILFEFFNLLLAPGIADVADNTPMFMLVVMVLVAATLVPVHQFLEKRVINRLAEQNKNTAENS